MKIAIFPGSFDPPTLGHVNVIERAAKLVDQLIVAVGHNHEKPYHQFTDQERIDMLKKVLKGIRNVKVVAYEGLLVQFAKKVKAQAIVRSIRNVTDYDYEVSQSGMNRALSGLETLFLIPDEKYRSISSSLIKEVASAGHPVDLFVPKAIAKQVLERYQSFYDLPF
jgi:pantetheine-phosphate adenylyltransferase